MIVNAGDVVILKNIARGKAPISAIACGDGAFDPNFGVGIAPSPTDVSLRSQIFLDQTIQSVSVIQPASGLKPRILIRHVFNNQNVPSIGRDVSYINEVGLYAIDPDTSDFVLVAVQAFNNRPFRIPASGRFPSPDIRPIRWEVFGG